MGHGYRKPRIFPDLGLSSRYLKKLWVGLDEIFWTGSDWDIKPLENSG